MNTEQIYPVVKANRYDYWSALKKVFSECDANVGNLDHLSEYLEEHYGIKMDLSTDSMITSKYTVVNEEKHLIFLLKFM